MMAKVKQIKIPKTLFKRYAGKRVAIVNGRVVAATNDAVMSYKIAKEKYPDKKISIFHVPRREDKHLLIRTSDVPSENLVSRKLEI